jgi:hypothetical protein
MIDLLNNAEDVQEYLRTTTHKYKTKFTPTDLLSLAQNNKFYG